jgi:plastocyanin
VRKRAPATAAAAAIAQIQTEQSPNNIEERGGNSFRPNPVEIKVGDTITRINEHSNIHTVTSETAKENNDDMQVGKEFDSDYLEKG